MKKPIDKTKIRLSEGQEIFYWDGRTLIEKVTVKRVDKKEKTALLANGILLDRYPNKEGYFPRADRKKAPGKGALLIDTNFDLMYSAYKAKIAIQQKLAKIAIGVKSLKWQSSSDADKLININTHLDKLNF